MIQNRQLKNDILPSIGIFILILLWFFPCQSYAQHYKLISPDERTEVRIDIADSISFSISKENRTIIPSVKMNMILLDGSVLGVGDKVVSVNRDKISEIIRPAVSIKNSIIKSRYNQLKINFENHFSVFFKLFDDALAYRFALDYPDSVKIKAENIDITFSQKTEALAAFSERWMNDYQNLYRKTSVKEVKENQTIQLPLLIDPGNGNKLLITESNLYDYPGLYFSGTGTNTLHSAFPPKVKSDELIRGKMVPDSTYNFLTKTKGKRTFPWRIFAIADEDKQLLNNEIVYKLAEPNRLKDTKWIQPGQVSWDWWNHLNITGVDFRAGINTRTYKYYIDFAADNGIPYVLLDAGWSPLDDLLHPVDDIDMEAIVDYGRERGVGVMLWCKWYTLDAQMEEAMKLFQKWGIKGLKVDHIDRDDQDAVNFYWRCAREAARYGLVLNFHGSHKPAGIQRTYPNVLNFEGVLGLEEVKGNATKATPGMAVTIPYTRMFAGPIDYTPGAMRNAQKKDFVPIRNNPMSMGTRCQQLAMYIVYDAPLQMLCDNPTAYKKNKVCLDFITNVPTTWDKTIPLDGKVGAYVVLARKKEEAYFIGAMTNWDERELTIPFSFLPKGKYKIIIFRDGINADRNGIDYEKVVKTITNKDELKIHLAPGGGWAARIIPQNRN